MRPTIKAFALIAIAALAIVAAAQTQDSAPGPVIAGAALAPRPGMFAMHVDGMDAAPVKDAPFCATVTTEHTQSFADGNRIHTSNSSLMCRDSEGRTRREADLNLLGAGAENSSPKLITIVDPVAGVRYLLDPDDKIAHKMTTSGPGGPAGMPPDLPAKGERMMVLQNNGGPDGSTFSTNVMFRKIGRDANQPPPAAENLGDQMLNGIHATGTRITTTIPAGQMGNDKPISVTSERWYSQDLKATVMTKHSDPWAGELKTEFTNVNTSEPDPSLFSVPSDYKIVDDKNGPFTIRMSAPAPPGQ